MIRRYGYAAFLFVTIFWVGLLAAYESGRNHLPEELTAGGGLPADFELRFTGGTGWYSILFDGGDISYNYGTDATSVGLTGVITLTLWIDTSAQTFYFPEQILLNNFPHPWYGFGRRIDDFSGTIDPDGVFAGSAHFAGTEFTSLTDSTITGLFVDGNSPGFNPRNGLVLGDTFTAVLTDTTGLFDLVIAGTLISQPKVPCDNGCVSRYSADAGAPHLT